MLFACTGQSQVNTATPFQALTAMFVEHRLFTSHCDYLSSRGNGVRNGSIMLNDKPADLGWPRSSSRRSRPPAQPKRQDLTAANVKRRARPKEPRRPERPASPADNKQRQQLKPYEQVSMQCCYNLKQRLWASCSHYHIFGVSSTCHLLSLHAAVVPRNHTGAAISDAASHQADAFWRDPVCSSYQHSRPEGKAEPYPCHNQGLDPSTAQGAAQVLVRPGCIHCSTTAAVPGSTAASRGESTAGSSSSNRQQPQQASPHFFLSFPCRQRHSRPAAGVADGPAGTTSPSAAATACTRRTQLGPACSAAHQYLWCRC